MPDGRFLHVAADPEAAWEALARHLLHEMRTTGARLADARSAIGFRSANDLDELRASGLYSILTPGQCIDLARRLGPAGGLEFVPLISGADPSIDWEALRLVEAEVLPVLVADGLIPSRQPSLPTGIGMAG
jgi:hypothetical protein